MKCESKYQIVLLDAEGFILGERVAETLRDAKQQAKYLMSERWAEMGETTHANLGSVKVEVRNQAGECLFDDFLAVTTGSESCSRHKNR